MSSSFSKLTNPSQRNSGNTSQQFSESKQPFRQSNDRFNRESSSTQGAFVSCEDIAKKTSGITAVKSRFKNISPRGLSTSTCLPKLKPKTVPAIIPISSFRIPL